MSTRRLSATGQLQPDTPNKITRRVGNQPEQVCPTSKSPPGRFKYPHHRDDVGVDQRVDHLAHFGGVGLSQPGPETQAAGARVGSSASNGRKRPRTPVAAW